MNRKILYRIRILFFASMISSACQNIYAQPFTEPSELKQFNVTVNFESYTVKTQMLRQNKKIDINNERTYMWYAAQRIMETKGGFDGKLIHGTFRSFYLNNQLKEKGEVKYGLKDKEWKYWYTDGKLKEVINWKSGVKNGSYYLYNDYGELMAKSNFKKDKLNGSFYTYGPNKTIIEKKKYKNGDEVVLKAKQKGHKKFWSFTKKNKTANRDENELKIKGEKKPSIFKRWFKSNKKAKKAKPKQEKEKRKTVNT